MCKQLAKVMNKREKERGRESECVQGKARERERKEEKKIDHYSVFFSWTEKRRRRNNFAHRGASR